MKEIVKINTEGTVSPPEDLQKIRRWIKTIEEKTGNKRISGSGFRPDPKTPNKKKSFLTIFFPKRI